MPFSLNPFKKVFVKDERPRGPRRSRHTDSIETRSESWQINPTVTPEPQRGYLVSQIETIEIVPRTVVQKPADTNQSSSSTSGQGPSHKQSTQPSDHHSRRHSLRSSRPEEHGSRQRVLQLDSSSLPGLPSPASKRHSRTSKVVLPPRAPTPPRAASATAVQMDASPEGRQQQNVTSVVESRESNSGKIMDSRLEEASSSQNTRNTTSSTNRGHGREMVLYRPR